MIDRRRSMGALVAGLVTRPFHAMAQATGTFHGALWVTAGVMSAGMALLASLPEEQLKN